MLPCWSVKKRRYRLLPLRRAHLQNALLLEEPNSVFKKRKHQECNDNAKADETDEPTVEQNADIGKIEQDAEEVQESERWKRQKHTEDDETIYNEDTMTMINETIFDDLFMFDDIMLFPDDDYSTAETPMLTIKKALEYIGYLDFLVNTCLEDADESDRNNANQSLARSAKFIQYIMDQSQNLSSAVAARSSKSELQSTHAVSEIINTINSIMSEHHYRFSDYVQQLKAEHKKATTVKEHLSSILKLLQWFTYHCKFSTLSLEKAHPALIVIEQKIKHLLKPIRKQVHEID